MLEGATLACHEWVPVDLATLLLSLYNFEAKNKITEVTSKLLLELGSSPASFREGSLFKI